MLYRFELLSSTNDEACNANYREGDIIWAEYQSAGRGQRGHSWLGGEGENITFSAIFEPRFLEPVRQFLLSEAVALGVVDALQGWGIEPKIKWTNDIYVGNSKIAGILLEHKLQGCSIERSIAGVGLNINQTRFDSSLPNPISMAQVMGREFEREQVLESVREAVWQRYEQLRRGEERALQEDYHRLLYALGELREYALPNGEIFSAKIVGVEATGGLILELSNAERRVFAFKEVEFILKQP